MTEAAQLAHMVLFGIDLDQHLSAMTVDSTRARRSLVPILGGLLMGLFSLGVARLWPRRAIDPIEANALHGGRMSLTGSIIVMLQTIISNGVGASIGLEAGYTQIGCGARLAPRAQLPGAAQRSAPAGRLRRGRRPSRPHSTRR